MYHAVFKFNYSIRALNFIINDLFEKSLFKYQSIIYEKILDECLVNSMTITLRNRFNIGKIVIFENFNKILKYDSSINIQ